MRFLRVWLLYVIRWRLSRWENLLFPLVPTKVFNVPYLACDPSCESCSSPSGTCVTCQSGLQPLSTDATKCTTASTALANGTFIDCRERTFFDIRSSTCLDCNPLCESCFATGTAGCLSCRSPNGLLDGACVGVSSTTGICDSRGLNTTVSKNAQWVYDNAKEECDGQFGSSAT